MAATGSLEDLQTAAEVAVAIAVLVEVGSSSPCAGRTAATVEAVAGTTAEEAVAAVDTAEGLDPAEIVAALGTAAALADTAVAPGPADTAVEADLVARTTAAGVALAARMTAAVGLAAAARTTAAADLLAVVRIPLLPAPVDTALAEVGPAAGPRSFHPAARSPALPIHRLLPGLARMPAVWPWQRPRNPMVAAAVADWPRS